MLTNTVTEPHATESHFAGRGPSPPPSVDVTYSMAPITRPDKAIALGKSYAFGFNIKSNANQDAVYFVSSTIYGDVRRGSRDVCPASNWLTQVLDPPVVAIPANGSATVLVEVTATDEGDEVEPSRCELVVSVTEISPAPHVVPGQARLSIMTYKTPPGPESQTHVQVVLNSPGQILGQLNSGIQVGTMPIDLQVFVDTPGDYTVTAEVSDKDHWTVEHIWPTPFHVNAGDTAGTRVNVGPVKPRPGARQTDLFITVAGMPGSGISATFPLPIMPWK